MHWKCCNYVLKGGVQNYLLVVIMSVSGVHVNTIFSRGNNIGGVKFTVKNLLELLKGEGAKSFICGACKCIKIAYWCNIFVCEIISNVIIIKERNDSKC